MKLKEFVEIFDSVGIDIQALCEGNGQNIVEELHYLTHGGLARFVFSEGRGDFSELIIFCRRDSRNPKDKTIFQYLQRLESRACWFKEDKQQAETYDSHILEFIKNTKIGEVAFIRANAMFLESYNFDSVEEGVLHFKSKDFI